MPRPGPRPFECVRRSWHSDRHQPIRGSVIQQIFRVLHENHSPGTKKNREWQQKLPLVVLKSEEIIYSKANSEAEYLDTKTLWGRLNDAIDTIIRKDETMETGEFLPPCVEAALNLGCVPVRSSRSQRNTTARSYLSPRNQDYGPSAPSLNIPNVQRPNGIDQTEANNNTTLNLNINFPTQMVSFENRTSSIYPLFHGFHFQPRAPHMGFSSNHQNSNNIIVGMPVFQPAHESLPSSQKGCSERLFSFDRRDEIDNGSKKELVECDLSLRLGLVSSNGKELTCVNHVDSGLRSKEFSFFPLNSEAKLVTDIRKRKTVDESQQLLERGFDHVNEGIKRRGL